MATFYNQATLSYNGTVLNSNIVSGEVNKVLSITKSSLDANYRQGQPATYVISLVNSGDTAITNAEITDNLGRFETDEGVDVVPLTYNDGTARYYINGAPQSDPAVTAGANLVISGITIPANGNAMILYDATPNEFAPFTIGSSIENTASVAAPGIVDPTEASLILDANTNPELSIIKSVSPTEVTENGQITYTFIIQNTGALATAPNSVVLNDTFDPVLNNISVTLNDTTIIPPAYSYDEATGIFSTAANTIQVPEATFVQNPVTGEWTITPGTTKITVTGII